MGEAKRRKLPAQQAPLVKFGHFNSVRTDARTWTPSDARISLQFKATQQFGTAGQSSRAYRIACLASTALRLILGCAGLLATVSTTAGAQTITPTGTVLPPIGPSPPTVTSTINVDSN